MSYQTKAALQHKNAYMSKSGGSGGFGASATVMSKSQYANIQALMNGADCPTTVSASELQRMRSTASGQFDRDAAEAAGAAAEAKQAAAAKAAARKEKMRRLEEERKQKVAPSEMELKRQQDKAAVVSAADMKLNEELDDVKKMNQMCLYSKVVTIRDAQVHEKKVVEKERQEEERRLDTIMEIERLKALQMFEEREARRKEDSRKGAQVIIDQIAARERERIRRVELQDQERLALIAQNEDMKKEERQQMVLKVEAGKKLLNEVALSNAEQIALKKRAASEEKEEERRIAAYIRDKEMREQEHHMEQERIKAERERETAKLRAMQEKMKDKQAELDALRAKRAVEEAERTWRKKEREEVERQITINETLGRAREAQKLEKERRLIDQAQQEKEEFDRILRVQREADSLEKEEKSRKSRELSSHQEELQAQIMMNSEVRKKDRMNFLEEGKELSQRMQADRTMLESIKQSKLEKLHSAGVPQKYTVDLYNKRFT